MMVEQPRRLPLRIKTLRYNLQRDLSIWQIPLLYLLPIIRLICIFLSENVA